MKRLGSHEESLGALISICPNSTDQENNTNGIYNAGVFEAVPEEEEPSGQKKRRLSVDQVRALEKNFEVENKLEPERKVKLAEELGLQPRQVAVWFQNRRARWKTKQLEKDYSVLKASYDGLKLSFEKLHHDHQALLKEESEILLNLQIGELKSKVKEERESESKKSVKEEGMGWEREEAKTDVDDSSGLGVQQELIGVSMFLGDGSSDSDSSAILNEENSPTAAVNSSSSSNGIVKQVSSYSDRILISSYDKTTELVKNEEHDFFGEEESCSGFMFSEDQAPTLHWYSSDEYGIEI